MKNQLLRSILLIIAITIVVTAYGQNSSIFMMPLDQGRTEALNATSQSQLQKLSEHESFESVSAVGIEGEDVLLHTDILKFYLPDQKTIDADLIDFNYVSSAEYTWHGETSDGEVLIMHVDGRTFGNIRHGDDVYDLQYLESGRAALIKYDMEKLRKGECAAPDKGKKTEVIQQGGKGGTAQAIVRVLVLFTPNAAATGRNINEVVNASMGQFLTASVNSSVQAALQLAGVVEFDFDESTDMDADVTRLRNSAAAQQLRNDFEADLVVLMTDGAYGNFYGIVSEIGPDNDDAYTIVEIDQATATMTFAHEVGHLFGCRHQNDPTPGDMHGYGFKTGSIFKKKRGTIMHTLQSGRSQILHFSNPNRTYKGKSTGNVNTAFNSRVININSRIVCEFRFTPPALNVNINGPGSANDGDRLNFTSSVSNGTAPFTYRWQANIGGGFYNTGSSSSLSYTMPTDRDLTLRLTVTDANGNTDTDEHFVRNLFLDGGPCEICPNLSPEEEVVTENSFSLFPNPSADATNLAFDLLEDAHVQITLTNLSGKIIETIQYEELEGRHELELDLSTLDRGMYLVQFETENYSKTVRLVKE